MQMKKLNVILIFLKDHKLEIDLANVIQIGFLPGTCDISCVTGSSQLSRTEL